jgi:hypothetical protein
MCELLVGLGEVRVLAVDRDAGGLVVEVETSSERGVVSYVRAARGAQGPPAGGAGTPGLLRTTDDAGVA